MAQPDQVSHMALFPFIDWCVLETKGWLENAPRILNGIKCTGLKTSENFQFLVLLISCSNCYSYKKVDH